MEIEVLSADRTSLLTGHCLEPHDLALSKLAANRDRDWEFVAEMLRYELVDGERLLGGLDLMQHLDPALIAAVASGVKRLVHCH